MKSDRNVKNIQQQAQDATTPPEILRDLATHNSQQIRQYVASNPNTPVEILEKIGAEFPEEVVNNPIFELLRLENPESEFISLCLARSVNTTARELEKIASKTQQRDIYVAIAYNNNVSTKALEIIFRKLSYLARELLKDTNLPAKVLEHIFYSNAECQADALIKEIELCPSCFPSKYHNPLVFNPYDFRTSASYDPGYVDEDIANSSRIQKFARHSSTTVRILNKLRNNRYSAVRQVVATSSKLTPEIIEELSQDLSCHVRSAIALNELTPESIVNKLKLDPCITVTRAVARRLSISTIKELSQDTSQNRRDAIAIYESTPIDIPNKLHSSAIRQATAANPNTPLGILRELLYDNNPNIAKAAMQNINSLGGRSSNI